MRQDESDQIDLWRADNGRRVRVIQAAGGRKTKLAFESGSQLRVVDADGDGIVISIPSGEAVGGSSSRQGGAAVRRPSMQYGRQPPGGDAGGPFDDASGAAQCVARPGTAVASAAGPENRDAQGAANSRSAAAGHGAAPATESHASSPEQNRHRAASHRGAGGRAGTAKLRAGPERIRRTDSGGRLDEPSSAAPDEPRGRAEEATRA